MAGSSGAPRSWEYVENGRVTSFQEIALPPDPNVFERWGAPDRLRWLVQRYFALDEYASGGLARLRQERERLTLALAWPPLPLLVLGPPRFEQQPGRRACLLPLQGGWLVAPRGSDGGQFGIALLRSDAAVHARLELLDYAVPGGSLPPVRWLYLRTQARVHAWIGCRFLAALRQRWLDPPAPGA